MTTGSTAVGRRDRHRRRLLASRPRGERLDQRRRGLPGCRTNGVDDDGNGYVDDWRGWDFVGNDNDPLDDNDHGTHVAGTIGATGDERDRRRRRQLERAIMALRFLDADGYGDTADAVTAILYAADKGIPITNNSWGGGEYSQALARRDRGGRPQGHAVRRRRRQQLREQRRRRALPVELREPERDRGRGDELARRARLVLELRRADGRPRRSGRRHLLAPSPAAATTGTTARRWRRRTSPARSRSRRRRSRPRPGPR